VSRPRALPEALFLFLALGCSPLGAQDQGGTRTAVTKETLPGVYRAQVAIYTVTITVRPDGSMSLADLPVQGQAGASLEGAWSLDERGLFTGRCKPEGKEEVTLEIDFGKLTLEDLQKTAAISLKSNQLGEKPVQVRLSRVRAFDPERDALAKKPRKPAGETQDKDLARLIKYLRDKCTEEVCRYARAAKELYAQADIEARIQDLGKRLEGFFKK